MKAADEPVFASARKETVEDPIGTLIPVVVPEWPVAVEEVARAAAAATVVTNVTVVEVFAPPAIAAVTVVSAAAELVRLIQATPLELKLLADRLYAAPGADETAPPLTAAISPVPEGVRVTASPGARIAALPATSLRVTLIKPPLALAAAADEFCFVRVMVETPAETLIVKVFDDSLPESDA